MKELAKNFDPSVVERKDFTTNGWKRNISIQK